MKHHVDIHMPVRDGGFIAGDTVRRLLNQDACISLYVDAGDDLRFQGESEAILSLISSDDTHLGLIRQRLAACWKRNRLRHLGTSRYIYLADPDVLLPPEPLFGSMIDLLESDPEVGAVGLCYLPEYEGHVATGSMMIARHTLEQVGELRHLAEFCECDYIKDRLEAKGLRVCSLRPGYITHLREEYRGGYPDYAAVRTAPEIGGLISNKSLEKAAALHGVRFKIFFDSRHAE